MRGLLDAVMSLGRGLELPEVLRGIVEAAVALTDAEYGALGIVGDGQTLQEFLTVGMSPEMTARIGQTPCGRGILGELIHHPEPLRLTDLSSHPHSYGFPPHHPPMHSFLGVPVRVREEVFGNLYLTEKRGGRSFDADDEAVLTTLSIAAGVAIDNARMYEESRRREQRLEALGEITRALLSGTDADEVLHLVAERAMEVAGADRAAILLPPSLPGAPVQPEVPAAPDRLTVSVAHGRDADRVRGLSVPAPGSLAGLAARTGTPVHCADVRTDPRAHPFGGADEGLGPVVAVPLRVGTGARGALRLGRPAGRPPFDDSEVALVSGFADQAAIALELARGRAESEELAVMHDRDRIARDLHDLAIQRLFATGMTLQSTTRAIADRPEAAERVRRAVDDLDTTIRIVRSTIFDLRTTDGSGHGGLRHRIAETARTASRALGFRPSVRIDGPVDSVVPDELAEHVVAVAAEAVSNASRHARASRIDIALSADEAVTLTVTDDGVGIGSPADETSGPGGGADADGVRRGGGLANMRKRAELCGGTLTVERPAGGGTRISWRAPLD
ncbi:MULTISPECIES: GAF domain-containing sensor histidine kinase [Streptomyces]|uniref:GAF domain-containing sensor histidine kinase n=1 Tax=Streptomyces TaxID=1883 RepID=UPI00081B61C6|nr:MULTISPECIES: GAF domain-containing protein [unclassified Streptomyces]MYQ53094.1 GAF domain-containing protein [Streptomyces sp. SID4941]SCD97690.1 Histidine kinase-, DNA gyrase B-, and HSP90-like ATPase [Streptomyces sp. PalvLS-984]SDB88241.1 Histidine kinase [Streptomyces sp. AmelKG-A3]